MWYPPVNVYLVFAVSLYVYILKTWFLSWLLGIDIALIVRVVFVGHSPRMTILLFIKKWLIIQI